MFEDRPYRQKRHSFWSIWWVVGIMATGLTAWHLEMLPIPVKNLTLTQTDESHPESVSDSATNNQIDEVLAQCQPADSTAHAPEKQEIFADQQEPGIISQVRYEQPFLGKPATTEVPGVIEQQEPVVNAHDLMYRPDEQPVEVKPIPNFQGEIPVQQAGYQQYEQQGALPIQTALNQTQTMPTTPKATTESTQTYPDESFQLSAQTELDLRQLRELSTGYWKDESQRQKVSDQLQLLAHQVFFQPDQHFLPAHVVQPGDQLRLIAKQYQIPWQYLARLNRVEPEQVRAGQALKVIQGPFGAVVDLSDRRLTVHANGYYVASFPVAVGKNDSTPMGQFRVLNKVQNPTYYGPNGVIPGDDPNNPLGEHWLDLGNGYGIHGTIDPYSIGEAVSKGCVRLRADDVALVYDLLVNDSAIVIRP